MNQKFLLLADCIFSWILYTRPRSIQDELVSQYRKRGAPSGETGYLLEKNFIRPSIFCGSAWSDGQEYFREHNLVITWQNLKSKYEGIISGRINPELLLFFEKSEGNQNQKKFRRKKNGIINRAQGGGACEIRKHKILHP